MVFSPVIRVRMARLGLLPYYARGGASLLPPLSSLPSPPSPMPMVSPEEKRLQESRLQAPYRWRGADLPCPSSHLQTYIYAPLFSPVCTHA